MPGRVTVPKVAEFFIKPWTEYMANAPANGVQYTSQTANANATPDTFGSDMMVNTKAILDPTYPGHSGKIRWAEYGVTVSFHSDNGDADMSWYLQAKNVNAGQPKSWVTITDTFVKAHPLNAAWGEASVSGYIPLQANCNAQPLEFRAQYTANTNSISQLRFKNSSYIRGTYQID